jgi:hypothetical protein
MESKSEPEVSSIPHSDVCSSAEDQVCFPYCRCPGAKSALEQFQVKGFDVGDIMRHFCRGPDGDIPKGWAEGNWSTKDGKRKLILSKEGPME